MKTTEPEKSVNMECPESVESDLDLHPRTALGRKLLRLRAMNMAAGAVLLTADEILIEKAKRRINCAPD